MRIQEHNSGHVSREIEDLSKVRSKTEAVEMSNEEDFQESIKKHQKMVKEVTDIWNAPPKTHDPRITDLGFKVMIGTRSPSYPCPCSKMEEGIGVHFTCPGLYMPGCTIKVFDKEIEWHLIAVKKYSRKGEIINLPPKLKRRISKWIQKNLKEG